jgi:CIC family chloride channel protein
VTSAAHRNRSQLGDFTLKPRSLLITAWALLVGGAGALAALALLRLIGLITNLVFYQRWQAKLVSPGLGHPAWWLVLGAPVAGGLIVGVMARYGSEKIRGHGMPEAIEAILTQGSIVAPKVAVLKPVSAAISIGTGGPFGAEGPIIMTGGAIGSMIAQLRHFTADERKALLVAGAAAGMAATFNSPVAAVLLAVELLLFEWRPRSFVPVVASVTVATICRGYLLGAGPIFPVSTAGMHLTTEDDALCLVIGLTGGALAVAATWLVYRSEDAFGKLPIHWMWWPAIGGAIIGLGGLAEPRALGVGYDVIDQLLTGRATVTLIIGILVVKTLIWSLSLGSGTSGGVLAPVFMIGGALGAMEGMVLPTVFPGFWAMLGLAAVVGGVMRSPLTGVIFTLELTHAWPVILPLLIASTSAYAISALVLKRSVLTEKIARRGLHLTREYSIDPLEMFFVKDVAGTSPVTLAAAQQLTPDLLASLATRLRETPGQRLIPVTAADGSLCGVTTLRALASLAGTTAPDIAESPVTAADAARPCQLSVSSGQLLREVACLFADTGLTSAPVTDAGTGAVTGVITLPDLLRARKYDLTEETHRERLIPRRKVTHPANLPGQAAPGPDELYAQAGCLLPKAPPSVS